MECSDTFVGAYAAEYLKQKLEDEWNIEAAVRYGCKASARFIEHIGYLEPIPWADEVDKPRVVSRRNSMQDV